LAVAVSAAPLAAKKWLLHRLAVNVGDDFADTLLLVTIRKAYPAFPESVLHGPKRRGKVTQRIST
jgi:hypothetical protein